MEKAFVSDRPMIVSSLRRKTVRGALFDVRESERMGADGFLLHAELIRPSERSAEALAPVFHEANKPVMVLNYRTRTDADDEKLNRLKLDCLRAGAAAVDLPIYSFDPDPASSLAGSALSFREKMPREVSMRPSAIEKQKDFIEQAHALCGTVLMSAHVGIMLCAEEVLELCREMIGRGADVAKVITVAQCPQDAAEILRTVVLLKEKLGAPFLYQTAGKYGKFIRPTAWLFGSSMVLCHNRYTAISNREKPLIRDVIAARRILCGDKGYFEA